MVNDQKTARGWGQMRDGHEYYFTESYLFDTVSERFSKDGSLGAFDFMTIVIWKANRAKSVTAKRLMSRAVGDETLDDVCRRLTKSISMASDNEGRFRVLWDWNFRLPMASAVLSVLFPEDFTVYDYRACEQLALMGAGDHAGLDEKRPFEARWVGYAKFIDAVRASSPGSSLRDADRALMGQSQAQQLERDIAGWSDGG